VQEYGQLRSHGVFRQPIYWQQLSQRPESMQVYMFTGCISFNVQFAD